MTIGIILLLVAIGFLLIIAEIFVLPGGIVGLVGVLCLGIGVYYGYQISDNTGNLIALCSGAGLIGSIILAFRTNAWSVFSVKEELTAKANEPTRIQIGVVGKTVSRLNPMGKAIINDVFVEVTTQNEYIEVDQEIEVVKTDGNRIFVRRK